MTNLPDNFDHAAYARHYEPQPSVDCELANEALSRCFHMSELLMAALDEAYGEVAHYDLETLTDLEAAMRKMLRDFPLIARLAKPDDRAAIQREAAQ